LIRFPGAVDPGIGSSRPPGNQSGLLVHSRTVLRWRTRLKNAEAAGAAGDSALFKTATNRFKPCRKSLQGLDVATGAKAPKAAALAKLSYAPMDRFYRGDAARVQARAIAPFSRPSDVAEPQVIRSAAMAGTAAGRRRGSRASRNP